MPSQDAIYRFGPYELHTRTHEVYKHGTKLKVRPQSFQVLQALVQRSGDVVTREEVRQLLWPGETFVDFEHGLNTAIRELRGLLNDSANEPRYVETLPKLGYRLLVRVELASSPQANQLNPPATPPPNNLSLQHSPFVGREREIDEISNELRGDFVRLLTLTGVGGTGKTALGLAAGRRAARGRCAGIPAAPRARFSAC